MIPGLPGHLLKCSVSCIVTPPSVLNVSEWVDVKQSKSSLSATEVEKPLYNCQPFTTNNYTILCNLLILHLVIIEPALKKCGVVLVKQEPSEAARGGFTEGDDNGVSTCQRVFNWKQSPHTLVKTRLIKQH